MQGRARPGNEALFETGSQRFRILTIGVVYHQALMTRMIRMIVKVSMPRYYHHKVLPDSSRPTLKEDPFDSEQAGMSR